MNKKFNRISRLMLVALAVMLFASGCKNEVIEPSIVEVETTGAAVFLETTMPSVEAEADDPIEETTPVTAETEDVLIIEGENVTEVEMIDPAIMETIPLTDDPAIEGETSFEQYNAMSGAEQAAFMESFDSVEAFFEWYNAAKADYEASAKKIEITGNEIISVTN